MFGLNMKIVGSCFQLFYAAGEGILGFVFFNWCEK